MHENPRSCSVCREAFKDGQAAYTSTDAEFCQSCAEARAPKCEICGQAAVGLVRKTNGKLYHVDCLKCSSCSCTLGIAPTHSVGNAFYCTECSEDIKKLVALAIELDQAGNRRGAAELAQRLADKGLDIPEALLQYDDGQASGPPCAMCEEVITTKCGSIMGKEPVCQACGQSVMKQLELHQELSKRGEFSEALGIARGLAAKGLDVPSELLEERAPLPKCALCTNVIMAEYIEMGDEKKKVCLPCRDELNSQFQEMVKLASANNIPAACKVAESLNATGLPIPKPMEDMLEQLLKVPSCLMCTARISGRFAPMGDGYICFDCGESVNADIKRAMAFIDEGDCDGAAEIGQRLRAKGVPLPDELTEANGMRSVAGGAAKLATAEDALDTGPEAAPVASKAAGSGASAAKALTQTGKAHAATAKALAKAKVPAAKAKTKATPAPKAATPAAPQKVSKAIIDGGSAGGKLQAAHVFVRIRPLAKSGGHAEDGQVLAKVLDSWDEKSVTIGTQCMFSKGEAKYTFPKRVFGPESTQQAVYDATASDLVESFTQRNGYNVLFFAYGQTGTGKTHTMFGTERSLQSRVFDEGWGVFPRVCSQTFQTMRAKEGVKFVILASAIEFHMGECCDLLGQHGPVQIDNETHEPSGNTYVELKQPEDLMPFLDQVLANRITRATKMNEGSSRSHAALMLDLLQVEVASNEYVKTTFTLVDLAGAERPEKASEGRMTGGMCLEFLPKILELRNTGQITEAKYKSMIPIGAQGMVINHELFVLGTEVLKATEQHSKNRAYRPPSALVTPTIAFLSAILDGKALLRVCVTLSSAGQNGWETWFSLQYGTDLSKLRASIHRQKPQDFNKMLKDAVKNAERLRSEFENAPMSKYWCSRKLKAESAASNVEKLQVLKRLLP